MVEHKVAIETAAGRGMGAGIAAELHAKGYKLGLMSPSGASEKLALPQDVTLKITKD
jgi:NAD(P)-dependent dehydrogenase (short-subunit alcohol dehydrogenase family)